MEKNNVGSAATFDLEYMPVCVDFLNADVALCSPCVPSPCPRDGGQSTPGWLFLAYLHVAESSRLDFHRAFARHYHGKRFSMSLIRVSFATEMRGSDFTQYYSTPW